MGTVYVWADRMINGYSPMFSGMCNIALPLKIEPRAKFRSRLIAQITCRIENFLGRKH